MSVGKCCQITSFPQQVAIPGFAIKTAGSGIVGQQRVKLPAWFCFLKRMLVDLDFLGFAFWNLSLCPTFAGRNTSHANRHYHCIT